MITDQFPLQCVQIIDINSSNEITLLAQTQFKNWVKIFLHPKSIDVKQQILSMSTKILVNSLSAQQFQVNYETFCICLDNLPLIDSMNYINSLMQSLTQDQFYAGCFIVQAACRRNRNSIKARDLFKQLFTERLFPVIYFVVDTFQQHDQFIVKCVLNSYNASLANILQEHMNHLNFFIQKLNTLYLAEDQYKQQVLEILLSYFINYKKINNYDQVTKQKYQEFLSQYQVKMLPQIQFVLKQLENYTIFTPHQIGSLIKILRFSFECNVDIPEELQLQLFNFILFLIKMQYQELVSSNQQVDSLLSLPIYQLHQLAQTFDSQIFTPLNAEYFYAASNVTLSINSLIDELARFLGVYFNFIRKDSLEDVLTNLFQSLPTAEDNDFYGTTIAIAQILRRMALNSTEQDQKFINYTIEIMNYYSTLIEDKSQKSWIALWLINAVINDVTKYQDYIQLTSELTNRAVSHVQNCSSIGQFFLLLVFIKQRLNSLRANQAAYNKTHFLDENVFPTLCNLLIHVSNSFPFYTEIYDSLVTATELLIKTHPEYISQHFSRVFKNLFTNDKIRIDQICDLLELFCTVFVIREAEIDVETYILVATAIQQLLTYLTQIFQNEHIQNLETASNAISALCANVETSELREEMQPQFSEILNLLVIITLNKGDWVTNYTISGILSLVDVFTVWEAQDQVFRIISQFEIPKTFHCFRFCMIFAAAHSFANSETLPWIQQNLLQLVDLTLCDVRIEFFAIGIVYLLLKIGFQEVQKYAQILAFTVSNRYDFVSAFYCFQGGKVAQIATLRNQNLIQEARELAGDDQIIELYQLLEQQGLVMYKVREIDDAMDIDELQSRVERIQLLSQEIIKSFDE
eukprot:EST45713.1 Hypothetical protein SS50377_14285 [Spironucleus salmonicida]